ncbi:TetR/AcrR family transcriptional regulator [Amycolatopsis jejuensis]|uniref:TetR/AcrR family transcriptional regulator n=1 Tax=Amycolatopsis jejuensis TaxID=330084 RepID=UPI0005253745|nr:TetR/AcrR family transcriptional regulator [Amycolatopsis jejuensis]
MSGTTRGNEVRAQLVTAAIRLLAEGGPDALQARKLAAEVGASTMAVYTHFGGMAALTDAVAQEGFRRLSACIDRIERTADPVADLLSMALAYRESAAAHPELFSLMFRHVGAQKGSVADAIRSEDRSEAAAAFRMVLAATERAVAAGRITGDALSAAAQVWSAVHGFVTLELNGHFGPGDHAVADVLTPLAITLVVGLGDSPAAARASAGEARVTTTE